MILFLITLAIVFFVLSQIDVVHVNTLPASQQTELKKRAKMRKILISNCIKEKKNPTIEGFSSKSQCGAHEVDSRDYLLKQELTYRPGGILATSQTDLGLPNASDLVDLINAEYGDNQYRFNEVNLPVSFRYPSHDLTSREKAYLKHIQRNIQSWNRLFHKYYDTNKQLLGINSINLISLQETEAEFIAHVNVSLTYLGRTLHVKLVFYGEIIQTDDFLNGGTNKYLLQLVEIKPIRKSDFISEINAENVSGPFITMDDQLSYVDRINYMHRNEMDL